MNRKIAVVTGAAGGIGREFIKLLLKEELDEIWAVGRNEKRLASLKEEFGERIVPVQADLNEKASYAALVEKIKEEAPEIRFLINNAGMAHMTASEKISDEEIEKTVNLNCVVPVLLMNSCLPYIPAGGRIINVVSASAFQPLPYLNLYASTKTFLRSYSRGMNMELKGRGVSVTAVCPSWVDTPMLHKEFNGDKVKYFFIVKPDAVARKAMKDAKRGKDMSVCSFFVKFQHSFAKHVSQKSAMKIWLRMIRKLVPEL